MLGFKRKDDEKAAPSVVKIIEVIGTSPNSFGDAVTSAIGTAAKSLRHISGADMKHQTVSVKDGKIEQYRVNLKVAFALDADDEDDE